MRNKLIYAIMASALVFGAGGFFFGHAFAGATGPGKAALVNYQRTSTIGKDKAIDVIIGAYGRMSPMAQRNSRDGLMIALENLGSSYVLPFPEEESEIELGNFYHYLGTVEVDGESYFAKVNQVEIFGVEDGAETVVTMTGTEKGKTLGEVHVMHGAVENEIATVIADSIIVSGPYDVVVEIEGEVLEYDDDIINYHPDEHKGELLH